MFFLSLIVLITQMNKKHASSLLKIFDFLAPYKHYDVNNFAPLRDSNKNLYGWENAKALRIFKKNALRRKDFIADKMDGGYFFPR